MKAGDIVKVVSNGKCYSGAQDCIQSKLPTIFEEHKTGLDFINNGVSATILWKTSPGSEPRYVIRVINCNLVQVNGESGLTHIGHPAYPTLGVREVVDSGKSYSGYEEIIIWNTPGLASNFVQGYCPDKGDIVEILCRCKHLNSNDELAICRQVDCNIVFAIGATGLKKITEEMVF